MLDAAHDESWRVRLCVAEALRAYADRDGAAVARRLLDDPSAEVERKTVLALANWPLEQAGPLLLEAMSKLAFLTRKTAAEQLAVPLAAGRRILRRRAAAAPQGNPR